MEFDAAKNAANIAKHGVSFEEISLFEWESAATERDTRRRYGELRLISYGMVKGRLHVLVWTPRNGKIRPISFRKANARERSHYEERATIH